MQRHPKSPVITRQDIVSSHPALRDVSSVFNPGGVRFGDKFLLLLRVQNRARETLLVKAISDDGVSFKISDHPMPINGLEACPYFVYHIYDPRITKGFGNSYDILCAMDTDKGCFLGLFQTDTFEDLSYIGIVSEPDVRNGVLLKGTKYRFERPNRELVSGGVKSGSTITCSYSEDGLNWQFISEVFSGRPHYWDELIGSGPPPLLCKEGWLHIYHGVATHFGSANIYQAGVSLQDRDEPYKTIARGKYNILEPRELYELTGQVPNVVFPSAAIPLSGAEILSDDTVVYIYYGAADSCVGLATITVGELIAHAKA